MFDSFKKLKLASAFLGVDSPAANAENLDIAELFGRLSLKDLRGMTLQADKLLEQPGVRALYESRYLPPPEPLDKLTDLGEGTLGCEYARYLRYHKLAQPRQPDGLDLGDANIYLTQRVRVTHPILHVVTEYDASPLGELALQAYYVGQLDNLMSGVIISSVLLQITRESPELLGPALEVTAEAYQRGKSARPFLGIAWEELWSAQVPQLRELIEIPARTSIVAQLRAESAARPAPSQTRSASGPAPAASPYGDDGFAALGRSSAAHAAASAASAASAARSSSSSSSSSSQSSSRGFAGFGTPEPAKPSPPPERPSRPSAPASPPSKLLASFMALAEQEAAQPTPPPAPEPPPRPVTTAPRVDPRPQPAKPPPLPPAKQPPPEPAYKVEETAKNITPALTPDDPDYF